MTYRPALTRPTALAAVIAMVLSGLIAGAFSAQWASAAPGPIAPRSASTVTVTADALPTVQINGVVWSQAIIGNTVYAGGSFSNARPAGAAPGVNTTTRNNLLAYNLSSGQLITSFAPSLNGQVQAVAASPDGTRIYVGGDFTTVNGGTRNRLAAFNASTGALITAFNVNVGSRVKAIVATNSTVYVGGQFSSANGKSRNRLAAFDASNGGVTTWNPGADYTVNALVLTPDGSRLIAGGAFQNVAGSPAYGLAAIGVAPDNNFGKLLPWAAVQKVRDAGPNSAILGLHTDGTAIYGVGYVYGTGGNLEGAFSASPNSGTINWIEDCHGDSYSVFSTSKTVYTVSHAHYCGNVGGYYQSDPWSTTMRHAVAFTPNATGTLNADPLGYPNWAGNPSPSIIDWFPELGVGSFTGQGQAAWNVTGNSQYVVMGGEFPTVNGVGQQGLVRFATAPTAPSKQGPKITGARFTPALLQTGANTVKVSFGANWDMDDKTLTYQVLRNGNQVTKMDADSTFWNRPRLGFTDTGLAAGSYSYRLSATDHTGGNQVKGDTVTITVGAAPTQSSYASTVVSQGAATYWRLGESSGATAIDSVGYNDGAVSSGVTRGATGAISGDANKASTFNGSSGLVATQTPVPAPGTFTIEAWFKTTTTSGGKIIGFGNLPVGTSPFIDRHIYMANTGKILFGVYAGGVQTVTSPNSYNNGAWHQAVATLGPSGMNLYIDGASVTSRTDVKTAQVANGFWRVGGDNLSGWTSAPTSKYFNGSIDEVSIYPKVLTSSEVDAQYVAGTTP